MYTLSSICGSNLVHHFFFCQYQADYPVKYAHILIMDSCGLDLPAVLTDCHVLPQLMIDNP